MSQSNSEWSNRTRTSVSIITATLRLAVFSIRGSTRLNRGTTIECSRTLWRIATGPQSSPPDSFNLLISNFNFITSALWVTKVLMLKGILVGL